MAGQEAVGFEAPIVALEGKIAALRQFAADKELDLSDQIEKLSAQLEKLIDDTYSKLTPWELVQVARHRDRPYTLDLLGLICDEFIEMHGDRLSGDDPAIVGGLARLNGRSIVVAGHQKGRETKEKLRRNFGMPHPEGYRKALRLAKLAEKFRLPLVFFIDTPGAYPGIGAEERGQGEAIAFNLRELSVLRTPIVACVIGEGGSGGALGIGIADRILILQYAYYSLISPEGCAAILWKSQEHAPQAAEALKLTPQDLLDFGAVDEILEEPPGGAHRDHAGAARLIRERLLAHLDELAEIDPDTLVKQRYDRFRRLGVHGEDS